MRDNGVWGHFVPVVQHTGVRELSISDKPLAVDTHGFHF